MAEAFRRGDVWWVDCDPSIGGEIQKTRPCIIVSNDVANRTMNRVQVVPMTSNTDRLYPSETRVTVAGRVGKAMADEVLTASKLRFGRRIATLSSLELAGIDRALRVQLKL